MVFQKRLDSAPNGFQIPAVARVPISAKGKRSARKKVEDNQMSAFDLLATLAGKLLAEREGVWTPCKERLDNVSPSKGGVFDQGSCDEKSHPPENGASGKNFFDSASVGEFSCKSLHSSSPMESCVCKVDDGTAAPLNGKRKTSGTLICDDATKMVGIECPIVSDVKPPVLVSSDSSVEFPRYEDCARAQSSSFLLKKLGRELHGDKDDDENSSVCTHPSYIRSKTFKRHFLDAHRRRKLMKSSNRKADPASFNNGDLLLDAEKKPVFQSQKLFYTRQRTPRGSFKRRKLFDRCSISPSCDSSRDEFILDSLAKGVEAGNLLAALNGENNISFTRRGPNSLYDSEDRPVKLSIKSFKVPELIIEIPANATVGSLKRTVLDAVMAIFGDGLHVGVLLHGKKVRDDNKTLRQARIPYEDKMDSLAFTLEPSRAGTSSTRNSLKEPAFIPSNPKPLNKFQAPCATFRPPPVTIPTTNCSESDHENSVPFPVDARETLDSDSKALVPLAATNPEEALSVVPLRKSRRSEITQQRRIRRPFSVSEVEALVQAVEKLGTGRWRDVKLRAFDNAKHRTYVDLKDKWKTLVHTARISPQQRRGEPVPQELLDRVLSAHSYWSLQQAKPAEPLLLT